ncbi:hypothetical protein ACFOYU_19280 [Microvirga sp. GCM10011540]|uniref:hypothetical protein n=1 Tax=Microvirga sp. GCM10011540 TaxID=3317338 RepID=UPI00361E1E98
MTNQSSDEQAVGETAGREQDVLQHVLTKLDYLNSLAIEQTGVEAEGHRRAFSRIKEGYAFILECRRSGEVLDAFVAEATRRQVPAPRRHDNPFLIFARASTERFNHEYGRLAELQPLGPQ